MLPTAEAESQRQTDANEHVQFSTRCHSFSNLPSIQKHGNELGFSLTLKGVEGSSLRSENLKHAAHYLQLRERAGGGKTTLTNSSRAFSRGAISDRTAQPLCSANWGWAPSPPSLRFVYKMMIIIIPIIAQDSYGGHHRRQST